MGVTALKLKVFLKEEPRFYDRRFNDIPNLTINILFPGKSYSKLYGAESRFNNIQFNDIPGIYNDGNLATQA